jgi:apolipoprotein N-acyltransferase
MKQKKNNKTEIVAPPKTESKPFMINVFFAVLSGVLLFLSFPKYGSGWLAWIAFIPLFFALRNVTKISQGLLLGFITGVVSYIGIIYWITYVTVNYGYLPLYVGIFLMLLLSCYLSVYISLFAGGVVFLGRKFPFYLTAPALWICFEYGKTVIITGFPWENLGYSQYLNTYLIQFADIAGVWGISFLIVLVNAAVFEVISRRSKKEYIWAGVVFSIMALIYIYGFYRVAQVNKAVQNSPGIEVSLIQGNIEQNVKWNESYQRETLNIYEELSLKKSPSPGSLIIWPETAAPFRFQERNYLHDQIVNVARSTKSWLLFGSISLLQQQDGSNFYSNNFYNSAYLLAPDGEARGRYDKVHLVPYGEYVPLRKYMPFVEGFTAGIGDFGKGAGYYPLSMNDKKIGVMICYEVILAEAARAYKNHSAELLVTITNDAWFGATSAPFQHFSMAVFRAVETRLYLVRAANTGISGIVDPTGRIIAQTGIYQEDSLKGYVKFVKIPTLYDKYGDFLVAVCFALMGIFFIMSLMWRSKNVGRKHTGNN